MKKLKDFEGQKIAIHFPTYELWLRRKEINPSDTWENNKYDKGFVYYFPNECFAISEEDYNPESKGYIVLPATDFLEEEFIYGQEYEFSDSKNFENSEIQRFGCLYPKESNSGYKYVCFTKNGNINYYKYARKINTERTEAITTAKELIAKFDIKQEEIY